MISADTYQLQTVVSRNENPQGGSHFSYEIVDLLDGRVEERMSAMESLTKTIMAVFDKAGR